MNFTFALKLPFFAPGAKECGTPFKMGMALDFETCGYGDSMGGTGLMGITPRMIVFKIPRERLKKSTF